VLGSNDRTCPNCTNRFKMPQCSICRLPVKGTFLYRLPFLVFILSQASHVHARVVCTLCISTAGGARKFSFAQRAVVVCVSGLRRMAHKSLLALHNLRILQLLYCLLGHDDFCIDYFMYTFHYCNDRYSNPTTTICKIPLCMSARR
jgi:hypothetical protein